MSDKREQAKLDVIGATGAPIDQVWDCSTGDPDLVHVEDKALAYAVSQRELVLRLVEALRATVKDLQTAEDEICEFSSGLKAGKAILAEIDADSKEQL